MRQIYSADPDLRARFVASSAAAHWEWVHADARELELGTAKVAIVDSLAVRTTSREQPGHLLLVRRLPKAEPVTRYITEVHPREAFESLLEQDFVESSVPARPGVLGVSPAMVRVRDQIRRIARFPALPVLILGETGTGKEVVARAIHTESGGRPGSMVGINCAAVPANLFESELFGVAAGAFTGAVKARPGLFEHGKNGTVFLDEIGDLPFDLQPKLLRALEERAFRKLGSNVDIPMTARVVSATHRSAAQSHVLRRDLFYRLSGFTIVLPPLAERREDIPLLAASFLDDFTTRHGMPKLELGEGAQRVLLDHTWPGNVRELRAVIERAAILADGPRLSSSSVGEAIRQAATARESALPPARRDGPAVVLPRAPRLPSSVRPSTPPPPAPLRKSSAPPANGGRPTEKVTSLREREQTLIAEAYARHGGNLSATAREVGLPRSTVRDRLRRLGVLQ